MFQDVAVCYMQQTNTLLKSLSKLQINKIMTWRYTLFLPKNSLLCKIVSYSEYFMFLSTVYLPNAYVPRSNNT